VDDGFNKCDKLIIYYKICYNKNMKKSTEAINFIKKNKVNLINNFANIDKFPPAKNPFSIFMTGSPGAGKTEFSKQLLRQLNNSRIVRIDADEIRNFIPQYDGKNSSDIQSAASVGVEKLHDHVIKNKQNVLVDGTLSSYSVAHKNITRSLKKKRKIGIFYIYQDPLIAWDFTKRREKIEGRNIPKKAFIEAFFNSRKNVNKLKKEFKNSIEVNLVIKNFSNNTEKIKLNITNVDNYLQSNYTIKSLTEELC
jgi:predicted ABC-type ATPase